MTEQAITVLPDPGGAIRIGDSTTDVEAARTYGCAVIAYVNKLEKHQTLASADELVISMTQLAETSG